MSYFGFFYSEYLPFIECSVIAKHIDFSILIPAAVIRGPLIAFHKKEAGAHGGKVTRLGSRI